MRGSRSRDSIVSFSIFRQLNWNRNLEIKCGSYWVNWRLIMHCLSKQRYVRYIFNIRGYSVANHRREGFHSVKSCIQRPDRCPWIKPCKFLCTSNSDAIIRTLAHLSLSHCSPHREKLAFTFAFAAVAIINIWHTK